MYAPVPQYASPPKQYTPPPKQYVPPPKQYVPPPKQYVPPPKQYASPVQTPNYYVQNERNIVSIILKCVFVFLVLYFIYKIYENIPGFDDLFDYNEWLSLFKWLFFLIILLISFYMYCKLKKGESLPNILQQSFMKFVPVLGQYQLVTEVYECFMN